MTASLVAIIAIALLGIALLGMGRCERDEGFVVIGALIIVFAAACIFIRSQSIESDRRYDLCIKEGREVVKILDRWFCEI